MSQIRSAVALAAVLVTVTACSSSAKDSSSSPPPSSSPASSSAPASSSVPAATPLSAIVLQAGDLPSTFTKATPDPDDPDAHAAVVACLGTKDTTSAKLDTAKSEFHQGDNSISSDASRFKSDSDVAADTESINSPKFDACQEKVGRQTIAKSLPAGTEINDISLHTTPGPNGGPSNIAGIGQGTVTLTANGQTVKVYTLVAYITGPRLEAEVDVTGIGAPIDDTIAKQAIAAVARRAAKG
jgi:hypothetical protein